MDGSAHSLCEVASTKAEFDGVSRATASMLNPFICDTSPAETLRNVGDLVAGVCSVMSNDEAAKALAPEMWRIGLLAQRSLRYEASSLQPARPSNP